MRDSMGQSAALTGGYGSSYAQSVGQQQYNEYLRSLGEVLPELYGLAWQRYSAEGEQLQDAYDMAWQRRKSEYDRQRDALADQRYEQERELEARRLAEEQEATSAKQLYQQRSDNYNRLYKLIAASGYQPTDAELNASGLTRAQAEALRYEYLRANKLLPGTGGGSSGGSGGRAGGSGGKAQEKSANASASTLGAGLVRSGSASGLTGLVSSGVNTAKAAASDTESTSTAAAAPTSAKALAEAATKSKKYVRTTR